MKRVTRALIAKQTVAICDAGFYIAPSGARVNIGAELDSAYSNESGHLFQSKADTHSN